MSFRPARIAFVGNFGLWRKGTIGSRTLPMAIQLRLARHQPEVIVPPWDAPHEAGTRVRPYGIPVRNVALRGSGGARHGAITLELLRAVLATRPDVVVAVKPKAYAGLLALLFAALGRTGRRPVRLVVDTDDWEGTGGWASIDGTPQPVASLVGLHERLALRVADHVVVASRALDTLARSVGVQPGQLSYVPNGAWEGAAGWPEGDREAGRRALGLTDNPVVLLYSRLFEFDQSRVVEVLRQVVTTVDGARLVIAGAGLQGEESELTARLRASGILDRTILTGWIERDRLPDILAAADVALVPMDDTLVNRTRCSVKLLDLMLAGRAIVADRVGQASEYLTDAVTGRLVDPARPERMVEAVSDLLRDRSAARALGEAAECAARADFHWEQQRATIVHSIVGRESAS